MSIVGKRLRLLRDGVRLSQAKLGDKLGINQSSLNRYEHGYSEAPYKVLLKYADYFDVSLDYIFGRTDMPQGITYNCKTQLESEQEQMRQFIEMCFDPASLINARLKQTLLIMMKEAKSNE